jgi:hypothetical protein
MPTITALPTAPSRSTTPAVFVTQADAWVAALAVFVTETNALATYLQGLTGSTGPIVSTSLTMATARLLGRTTAASGAIEEITIGSGLTLVSGVLSGTGATEASNAEVWAAADTAKVITSRRRLASSVEIALTDGATITPDFVTGINFGVTLAGNRTLANPTNAASGMSGLIYITQDATGTRTLAYGTNWKFAGGTPTLSTAANAVDVIAYNVRPSGLVMATLSKF